MTTQTTKQITYEEFKALCKAQNDKISVFDLFEVKCKKCGSTNVELFGSCASDTGYYNDISYWGNTVIKCHGCGNAKAWQLDAYTDNLEVLK